MFVCIHTAQFKFIIIHWFYSDLFEEGTDCNHHSESVKASRQMKSEQLRSNCPTCVRVEMRPDCRRWEKHGMPNCQWLILVSAIHGKLASSRTKLITRLSCLFAIIDSIIKQRKSSNINHAVGAFTIIIMLHMLPFAWEETMIALKLWVCND